jgi:Phospholipase_D-nuclease N-terminal/Short C-terminal domain
MGAVPSGPHDLIWGIIPIRTSGGYKHPKGGHLLIATSYPLLEVFWTMLIFFAFFIWIWLLIVVFTDIFRRHDTSGVAKVAWIVFIVILPYLGVFVYLIAEHKGMTERTIKQQEAAKSEMDQYVRSVAGQSDPTSQIANAKALLDKGAITQAEFDAIKQKALAG